MSPLAVFHPGQAIRGGIPVIFPQFASAGLGLRHGFARLLDWTPLQQSAACAGELAFALRDSAQSRQWWPHSFAAELTVQLAENQISTALRIQNTGEQAFSFTAALHTYLRVSDISQAALAGLQGCSYVDSTCEGTLRLQDDRLLQFRGEVDRIYPRTRCELTLIDGPALTRIHSTGFTDTVIWNPGPRLAATLQDLGAGNHAHFACAEAACVAEPIRLAPDQTWLGSQTLICSDQ